MSLFFFLVVLAAVGFGPGADAEENPIRKELERRQQQAEAERAEDGFLCGKTFVTFHGARADASTLTFEFRTVRKTHIRGISMGSPTGLPFVEVKEPEYSAYLVVLKRVRDRVRLIECLD